MQKMRLRDGLFWCRCADRTVFLDIERDRYFCLASETAKAFHRWVGGEACDEATFERLTRCGVLVPGVTEAALQPARIPAPCHDFGHDLVHRSRARCSDMVWATFAQRRARIRLRNRPLGEILKALRRWRHVSVSAETEMAESRRIGLAFAAIARFVRSADQCLPFALAAWELCNRRAVNAALVFGVRVDPFSAHCWVQVGDAVIVGDLEQARIFTPILAVPCDHATF
jgi:hypothetical protein